MNARKAPSKAQKKGEKAGEWTTLWFMSLITFVVGLVLGGKKAIEDNVHMPDFLGDDDTES